MNQRSFKQITTTTDLLDNTVFIFENTAWARRVLKILNLWREMRNIQYFTHNIARSMFWAIASVPKSFQKQDLSQWDACFWYTFWKTLSIVVDNI